MKIIKPKDTQLSLAHEFDTKGWRVYSLAFSPDSRTLTLVAHDHDAVITEMESWNIRTIPKPQYPAQRVAFSPDSACFIFNTFKDEPLQCWQTKTGEIRWTIDPGSMEAEFSPDGKTVAATRSKSVLLCDARDGRILHEMTGHKSRVDLVRFSSDGRRVATAAQSQVCLWDVQKGTLVGMVQEKKGEIHAITFSPDGRSLAVAGGKGVIAIFDSVSGKQRLEWTAHGCHIWHLAFSADSSRLMSQSFVGDDCSVRLWDLPTCREIYQAPPKAVWKFTPDNKSLILLIDGAFEVRDLATGELVSQLRPKTKSPVNQFAFSPDKNWMACGLTDDKGILVWKIMGMI